MRKLVLPLAACISIHVLSMFNSHPADIRRRAAAASRRHGGVYHLSPCFAILCCMHTGVLSVVVGVGRALEAIADDPTLRGISGSYSCA